MMVSWVFMGWLSLAAAETGDPCAAVSEADGLSALRVLRVAQGPEGRRAEERLALELRLVLPGECLITLEIEDTDFHDQTLSEQQAILAPALPDAAMVLWIDTRDSETWRIMLLTGGAPRSVVRVVETPGNLESLADPARVVAENLARIRAPSPIIDPSPTPEPEPEPEIETVEVPTPTNTEIAPAEPRDSLPAWAIYGRGWLSPQASAGPRGTLGGGFRTDWSFREQGWIITGLSATRSGTERGELLTGSLDIGLVPFGRDAPLRPIVSSSLLGTRFRIDESDVLWFGNLRAKVGLEIHRPVPNHWQPYAALEIGIDIRDTEVRRRSDSSLLMHTGPTSIHLSMGLRRQR